MATLYAKAAGGNWTAAGTWSNVSSAGGDSSGPPTAADDAVIDAGSGNVTIDAAAVCRSLDCTGYTGTLTHNAFTLTIGDATAGAGNVALKFVAGMTYTKSSTTTSAITFVSTSATQQTITTAGKVLGNTTFNATSNGSWIFSDAFSANGDANNTTLTLTKGSLSTGNQTVTVGVFSSSNSNVRSLTLGSSAITVSTGNSTGWNMSTSSNMTFTCGTSTITLSGSSGDIYPGTSQTYYNLVLSGSGSQSINSGMTATNITRTGTAVKTGELVLGGDLTVTGTFTVTGNSKINRVLVLSVSLGTTRTITAAAISVNAADFKDITGAGAASWDMSAASNYTGDCGGNSMKALGAAAFTTAATQTATGTASFSWSTHGWTSRVPLPQDDVVINNAFSASQTVTIDMPRLGKSISFNGCTGTPDITFGAAGSVFGSLNLTGVRNIDNGSTFTFEGRSAYTLTKGSAFFNSTGAGITLNAPGGSLTLQDALTVQGNLTIRFGTFNANNFNVTAATVVSNYSSTRAISMGSGAWTLTGTATVWSLAVNGNLTLTVSTSTIKFTNTTSTARTFAGGGLTYNNFWSDAGASTAVLTVSGSNTFALFKDTGTAAHTIKFTAGTTQTIATWTVSGSSGNVITIDSSSTATHALVKSGGGVVSSDYLNIQHSVATPASTWYAGANSTNNQAVATAGSGWIFTAPSSDAVGSLAVSFNVTASGAGVADTAGSAAVPFTLTASGQGAADFTGSSSVEFSATAAGLCLADAAGSVSSEVSIAMSGQGSSVAAGNLDSAFSVAVSNILAVDAAGSSSSSFSVTSDFSGASHATGSASTVATFNVATVGASDAAGSVSSSFSLSMDASGYTGEEAVGSGTVTISFSASWSGLTDAAGSSASAMSVTLSGNGASDASGSLSSTFSFDATGAGKADAAGSLSASFSLSTDAIGTSDFTGVMSSSSIFSLTSSGAADTTGSAVSNMVFSVDFTATTSTSGLLLLRRLLSAT